MSLSFVGGFRLHAYEHQKCRTSEYLYFICSAETPEWCKVHYLLLTFKSALCYLTDF